MNANTARPMELERWEWEQVRAIIAAARKLHEAVGDGDNGPAPGFMEAWEELDMALERWDLNTEKSQ